MNDSARTEFGLLAEERVLGNEFGIATSEIEGGAKKDSVARRRGSWREACFKGTKAERMRRMNRSTKQDMQRMPWTDNHNPSMEHIAGPIEVRCRADGVFGRDRRPPPARPGASRNGRGW
jgi:hypothetical protein